MFNIKRLFKKGNLELLIWVVALVLLAFMNPDSSNLVSLCPLKYLGFHYCPGCGLGRSIALLFRARFAESFSMHPLGFFAVIVIGYRVVQLSKIVFKSSEIQNVELQ
jgi:hypothetical protein